MRLSFPCALLVGIVVSGCTSSSPVNPTERPVIEPILIDSVTVAVAESFPVQVFAHVTGVVGDGCSTLLPIEQRREGSVVTLTINRRRPSEAICIQIALLFDQILRLGGAFPRGDYTLRVNDQVRTFRVD